MDANKTNLEVVEEIAKEDVEGLAKSQEHYGNSWKKRGGVGAFMMLARKWDRIENALESTNVQFRAATEKEGPAYKTITQYDIFQQGFFDQRDEGIVDDICDLRRYLLLVESEIRINNASGKGGSGS